MERFQSMRKAQKIEKNRIYKDITSAGSAFGQKYSSLSNKYQIERGQQISLDNKRWIVFNIDDKNISHIPPIQRKMPRQAKENTQGSSKKSYKNQHKNHKFQLSFASIDNTIQVNDSLIQAKSKCSNINASPFKNMSSLRSMKKDVTLTECSSFQSPKKQMNKPSIYNYLDKSSKNNKSNRSLLRLRQETLSKSQMKNKRKVDITHKCLNKKNDQSSTILLGNTIPTQQNQKEQLKQTEIKNAKEKQIQFLMLYDPIELLQRHAQPRNKNFDSQQKQFWNEAKRQQQKDKEQIKEIYPLDQYKCDIVEKEYMSQEWKEVIDDFIHQNTNFIVQNFAQESEKINDLNTGYSEQKSQIKQKQLFISQSSPTLDQNIKKNGQKSIKVFHSSEQKKKGNSQSQQKSIFSELKVIENIRIIRLQCGIGCSLIPQKIEDSFVSSISSSSLLHKKYRNEELVSLLNALILINPKIIKNIFVPFKNGYSCRLFYLGAFEIVEVDCDFAFDQNYYPIFGEAGQFLWFSVLIKAFAITLGSFEAVTYLKADQVFTIITGQQLYRLDLKDKEINILQAIQQGQKEKEKESNKIILARKKGIFYFISKLQTKKQKIKQRQKKRPLLSRNGQKGEQICYKSLSQFLKKQSRNYMIKQLYNDTKVELKERTHTHKFTLSTLIEEDFQILVCESAFPPEQINSLRLAKIRN